MRIFLFIMLTCIAYGGKAQTLKDTADLQQVVVTGTMRTVQKSSSPVPVEVYTPRFFMKNPSPALFDALQMVNGVRPQLNCNVCNTGDIHINGMEGPYTMVLIDGMPIVSSLASVYGLFGIPNSLVERIEVVKGPASSLYGSEAIGGLINVITKNPYKSPRLYADISSNSWLEHNIDLGMSYRPTRRSHALLGINFFSYNDPRDINKDNFTDVTLQKRVSVFNKISFDRKEQRTASVAMRFIHENRWGGEMQWEPKFRGTDSVYGEQITTTRFELIGNYQLPVKAPLNFSYSLNTHRQRSAYGTTLFNADQHVGFGQLTWNKSINEHELLVGLVGRYTFYNDNTPATLDTSGKLDQPDKIFLPGIFAQQELKINARQNLLFGLRYDYDKRHQHIITPRLAYKISFNNNNDVLRFNAGKGFRVVNLFTEDHAALTGARKVEIAEELKPEKSINANLNYVKKIQFDRSWMNLDWSAWYTYFSNRILPDYTTDPNKIIYDNLKGHSVSYGSSLNVEMQFMNSIRFNAGLTVMDVRNVEQGIASRQLLSERWSGNWAISYTIPKINLVVDYTGNVYGSMLLPLVSELDPRAPESPVWSIQNIQFSKKLKNGFEFYAGIKNLLNWTPAKASSFLITRSHDPFDKNVVFDTNGRPVSTPENPYALTFDPNYVYAPNQGIKIFTGMRYQLAGK